MFSLYFYLSQFNKFSSYFEDLNSQHHNKHFSSSKVFKLKLYCSCCNFKLLELLMLNVQNTPNESLVARFQRRNLKQKIQPPHHHHNVGPLSQIWETRDMDRENTGQRRTREDSKQSTRNKNQTQGKFADRTGLISDRNFLSLYIYL